MLDVACLVVEIDDVQPRVLRRLEVPLRIRLSDLHFVLQVAIGWQNGHPYEFRVGDRAWGLVDRDTPETNPSPAEKMRLSDLAAIAHSFEYNFVFGEDWRHSVAIEKVYSESADAGYPKLLAAEGRCPPADIGGPSGYETYLRAIAEPNHAYHETMVEWDDPNFDPHKVDIGLLQNNLAGLAIYLERHQST
jgi:hypothetical protein